MKRKQNRFAKEKLLKTIAVVFFLLGVLAIRWWYCSLPTYTKLLTTAMQPVGRTMYVWGGGWRNQDTGEGDEAVTLGVSPRWAAFAKTCGRDYDFKTTRFQVHDGLDCSGYIGWLVYNVFSKESGQNSYVVTSTKVARYYAGQGWGWYTPATQVKNWRAGDIMSMEGHVWMCLGTCKDGSVLLVHASPPGVRICGTPAMENNQQSQAIMLAEYYMQTYYADWYERFPNCAVGRDYLEKSARFRWYDCVLRDDKGYSQMDGAQVMETVFAKKGCGI